MPPKLTARHPFAYNRHSALLQMVAADEPTRSAKECAEYLCPHYVPTMTKYLTDGCTDKLSTNYGEFAEASRSSDSDEVGITTTSMVAVAGSCGLVALIVGFVSGFREVDTQQQYKAVPAI